MEAEERKHEVSSRNRTAFSALAGHGKHPMPAPVDSLAQIEREANLVLQRLSYQQELENNSWTACTAAAELLLVEQLRSLRQEHYGPPIFGANFLCAVEGFFAKWRNALDFAALHGHLRTEFFESSDEMWSDAVTATLLPMLDVLISVAEHQQHPRFAILQRASQLILEVLGGDDNPNELLELMAAMVLETVGPERGRTVAEQITAMSIPIDLTAHLSPEDMVVS